MKFCLFAELFDPMTFYPLLFYPLSRFDRFLFDPWSGAQLGGGQPPSLIKGGHAPPLRSLVQILCGSFIT